MLIYWAAEARSFKFFPPFFILMFPSVWKGMIFLLILLWCLFSLQCPTNLLLNWQSLLTEFRDKVYIFCLKWWLSTNWKRYRVTQDAVKSCRGCRTPGSRGCLDVKWLPFLRGCMCALWDPVEPWSGIKWDSRWSPKCHVPTRPLNQTYWSVHTTRCPNWHKGQINISRRDWARRAGKVTRGERVRDAAPGFDRREESVMMFLGCGLWMNMSCVSESIIQHYYKGGVVCSSRLSHTNQCPQSTVQRAVSAARMGERKDSSCCADWNSFEKCGYLVSPKLALITLNIQHVFFIPIL